MQKKAENARSISKLMQKKAENTFSISKYIHKKMKKSRNAKKDAKKAGGVSLKFGHPTLRIGPWCLKEGCGRRRVRYV